ncbi:hypothetical protein BpHYR1_007751 [Brachionus plicatilis]|uniref:Uncharacterized protein n=1 Tax=Brachionus plicatilis TaxID=10195 RepID=A0A3M7RNV7_BRAPC|nr:hypothetical protein BpHYR1_007751 [Brachionus plicatilis]
MTDNSRYGVGWSWFKHLSNKNNIWIIKNIMRQRINKKFQKIKLRRTKSRIFQSLRSEGEKHVLCIAEFCRISILVVQRMYQLLQFIEHVLPLQNLSFGIFNILFLFFCTKFHNALKAQEFGSGALKKLLSENEKENYPKIHELVLKLNVKLIFLICIPPLSGPIGKITKNYISTYLINFHGQLSRMLF